MKTINPITGESVRGFIVIICKDKKSKITNKTPKKKLFNYIRKDSPLAHSPYFSGEEALETMNRLSERGFDVIAYTNGLEEENISLDSMRELFS